MKCFKVIFTIIGAVIGAGFASGKEIYEYFAKYGIISIFYIIPLFFIFFVLIKTFLKFGYNQNEISLKCCNENICKNRKIFGCNFNYLNCFMFITFLILSSAMFSGLVSLILTYLPNMNFWIAFLCVFIFSGLMIKISFNFLSNISNILVPLIIFCIIINSGFSIDSIQSITFGINNILPLPFLTVLYASQNVFLASFIIIKSGKSLSLKEQNKVSFLTSLILSVLILLGILCFMANPEIANADLPFAEMSFNISPYFSLLFAVIMLFSIITTYSTTITSLKEYFKGEKKYNKTSMMLCLIALLSLLNFGTIIEYLYPIIGIFGVIYCFKINSAKKLAFKSFF